MSFRTKKLTKQFLLKKIYLSYLPSSTYFELRSFLDQNEDKIALSYFSQKGYLDPGRYLLTNTFSISYIQLYLNDFKNSPASKQFSFFMKLTYYLQKSITFKIFMRETDLPILINFFVIYFNNLRMLDKLKVKEIMIGLFYSIFFIFFTLSRWFFQLLCPQ